MPATPEQPPDEPAQRYWPLLRSVLLLQLKLSLDAMRDFLLIPVSIVCAIAGALMHPGDPGRYYRDLMHVGQRSDRWINLFGEFDGDEAKTDLYVRRVEETVRREYQRRRQDSGPAGPSDGD